MKLELLNAGYTERLIYLDKVDKFDSDFIKLGELINRWTNLKLSSVEYFVSVANLLERFRYFVLKLFLFSCSETSLIKVAAGRKKKTLDAPPSQSDFPSIFRKI